MVLYLEAEERGAERDRELHRERVAVALEGVVRDRLQLHHDVARDLPGLLLRLVLEGDVLRGEGWVEVKRERRREER